MRTGSFFYLLREGFRNISQNRLMSFATVGTLLSCLLLIGCSVLFTANVNSVVGHMESQNELVAFIDDDFTDQQIAGLEAEIRALDNVASVTFIDKDTGLKTWIENLGQSGALYDFLAADNPMPHSFSIKVKNLDDFDITVMHIDGMIGVDKLKAPTEVAEAMSGVRQAFTIVAAGIIIILVVVSLVIVANTIRITVFSRRREISIMRYVGATNMFIRLPFLFEGVILGILAGLLAYFLIWGGYAALLNWMPTSDAAWVGMLAGNVVPFKVVALPLLGSFLGAGTGIGALGSMLFIGKHIKV